jgi:hypothetical protein
MIRLVMPFRSKALSDKFFFSLIGIFGSYPKFKRKSGAFSALVSGFTEQACAASEPKI